MQQIKAVSLEEQKEFWVKQVLKMNSNKVSEED